MTVTLTLLPWMLVPGAITALALGIFVQTSIKHGDIDGDMLIMWLIGWAVICLPTVLTGWIAQP